MKSYPRQLIFVRRDLQMPPGKLAAQVAHACVVLAVSCPVEKLRAWIDVDRGNQTKIVLSAKSETELEKWRAVAEREGIAHHLVVDAAKTFFREPTVTCLGVGPVSESEAKWFKRARLYDE